MRRPTPISPTLHGIIDYTTSSAAAVAPKLLDFPEEAAVASYALAGGVTGLAATTRSSDAAIKPLVPLQAHGISDVALGLVLPALPFLLGFSRNAVARNFFFGLGAMTLMVTAFTNWGATPAKSPSGKRSSTRRKRTSSAS